jgi:hypothetical protein
MPGLVCKRRSVPHFCLVLAEVGMPNKPETTKTFPSLRAELVARN